MKAIHLHGAATRNNGRFIDAGATVEVGDKPEQISSTRADDLVNSLRALGEKAASIPATQANRPAAAK